MNEYRLSWIVQMLERSRIRDSKTWEAFTDDWTWISSRNIAELHLLHDWKTTNDFSAKRTLEDYQCLSNDLIDPKLTLKYGNLFL